MINIKFLVYNFIIYILTRIFIYLNIYFLLFLVNVLTRPEKLYSVYVDSGDFLVGKNLYFQFYKFLHCFVVYLKNIYNYRFIFKKYL